MKTGSPVNVSSVKPKHSEKKERKTLRSIQTAATDKENLVVGSRVLRSKSGPLKALSKDEMSGQTKIQTSPEKAKKPVDVKKSNDVKKPAKKVSPNSKKEKTTVKSTSQRRKIKIAADDLTSEAGPSEDYWEVLAERRRIALESALEENHDLHDEVKRLKEENRLYKEMLDESRALVEVLQEMIGEDQPDINNSLDDSVL